MSSRASWLGSTSAESLGPIVRSGNRDRGPRAPGRGSPIDGASPLTTKVATFVVPVNVSRSLAVRPRRRCSADQRACEPVEAVPVSPPWGRSGGMRRSGETVRRELDSGDAVSPGRMSRTASDVHRWNRRDGAVGLPHHVARDTFFCRKQESVNLSNTAVNIIGSWTLPRVGIGEADRGGEIDLEHCAQACEQGCHSMMGAECRRRR